MELTKPEKLILLMLADIHERLEINTINTKFLSSAIETENTWAIEWEVPALRNDTPEMPPKEVINVVDYLDMWMFIEEAAKSLTPDERAKIEQSNLPFASHLIFPGFDGNNESKELTIAKLLIDDMGRFTKFHGRNLNSHAPMLKIYGAMYEKFMPMRESLSMVRGLSADQIIEILQTTNPKNNSSK